MTNTISKKEKSEFVAALSSNLTVLRTKAGVSQEYIANFVGISRQSYGAVERGERKLSWNTYLALILFFDYNEKTHDLLHTLSAFPYHLIQSINGGNYKIDVSSLIDTDDDIFTPLDEQAKQSIKNMIMIEYARCTGMSGETIVKLFEGKIFAPSNSDRIKAAKALRKIKERDNADNKSG